MHFPATFLAVLLVTMAATPAAAQTIQQSLRECRQSEDLDRQFAACRRVITDRRSNQAERSTAHFVRGGLHLRARNFDQAIAEYDQVIRLTPRSVAAYVNRGNAWHGKGDYDRAIADFSQATELNPKHVGAHLNRGVVWLAKRDLMRAITDFSRVIQLDPDHAAARYRRGNAYVAQRNFRVAIGDYNRAVLAVPGFTAAYTRRGIAYRRSGDPERALADFRVALALPRAHIDGIWAHATARIQIAQIESAQRPQAGGSERKEGGGRGPSANQRAAPVAKSAAEDRRLRAPRDRAGTSDSRGDWMSVLPRDLFNRPRGGKQDGGAEAGEK